MWFHVISSETTNCHFKNDNWLFPMKCKNFTSHLGVKNGLVVFHNSNKLPSAPFTPILQDLRYLYLLLTSMFSFAQ